MDKKTKKTKKKRVTFYAEYDTKEKRPKYLNPEYEENALSTPLLSLADDTGVGDQTDLIDQALGKKFEQEHPTQVSIAAVLILIAIACVAALGLYFWINEMGANSYACSAGMTTTEGHFDVCYCGATTKNSTYDENRTWRYNSEVSGYVCTNDTNYTSYLDKHCEGPNADNLTCALL